MRGVDPLRVLIAVCLAGALGLHFYFRLTEDPRERDRPSGTGAISGRVVDDLGAPVDAAGVVASAALGGRTERWSTSTGPDGAYTVDRLPAGRFQVTVRKGDHASSRFSLGEATWLPTPIDLDEGGVMDAADVTLPRAATIGGTALDRDGRPLSGGFVRLIRVLAADGGLLGPAGTSPLNGVDADGRFVVADVEAGLYLLMARRGGDTGPRIYYPGVLRVSQADTVSIEPGQRLDGVRIREPRAPTTTATVSLPYDGEFLRDASLRVFDADSRLRGRPAEATVSRLTDRTFAIDDLPAGRFQVVASAGVPSGDRLSVRETIVSDGRTPLSLRLAWAHGVDVSGQVRTPDDLAERDLTGTSLRLMLRGGENARLARLESGGRFRAVGLAPGEYALVAARGLAVVAVTHGGRTRPGSVISVGAGAIEDLVVHLAQRARSLDVDVRDAAGQPTSDAVVALYPADVDRWFADGLPRFGRPSTAGRASFGNIPPGDYRIAAVRTLDPPWRRNWADPVLAEELEPASVPVTLQPGERRKLTVTVR